METDDIGYAHRFEAALRFAVRAHQGQRRKGSDVAYITHPVHVSFILTRYGFPLEVAIAGLLHDVVEDQGCPLARIEEQFGAKVAGIVADLSEYKRDAAGDRRSWEVRKEEALQRLEHASLEAVAVKAADVIHNARCTAQDLRREGPAVWQRFARGAEVQIRRYRRITQVVQARLGEHPLVDALVAAVEALAQAAEEAER